MTPLGVVFLFMLVNWWVEKHQRFLFNVYKRFFKFFVTFFLFLTFLFFLERFLHLCFSRYILLSRVGIETRDIDRPNGISVRLSVRPSHDVVS